MTALVDKQEAYLRIKKLLEFVDAKTFKDTPLGDGDDNDWSYVLVWYYTFDKPWLWTSQAAIVARSSPLTSKAFREHFTMMKIDSEMDDLGAAFRHLQQSLVEFEMKLKSLSPGKELKTSETRLEILKKIKTYEDSSNKIEKKIKKKRKDLGIKKKDKEIFEFISIYQEQFLDPGVLNTLSTRIKTEILDIYTVVEQILAEFGVTRESYNRVRSFKVQSTQTDLAQAPIGSSSPFYSSIWNYSREIIIGISVIATSYLAPIFENFVYGADFTKPKEMISNIHKTENLIQSLAVLISSYEIKP